jgi:hypothetical protein
VKSISAPFKITHETAVDYIAAGWAHAVDALIMRLRKDVEEEHLPEVKNLFHPSWILNAANSSIAVAL